MALQFASATANATKCSPSTIAKPSLFGVNILNVVAQQVTSYSTTTTQDGAVPAANWTNLNFCNVSVTYTHPGRGDTIHVNIWLPLSEWNGRFQGTGGGGWLTGLGSEGLAPAVGQGYAAAETDGGHTELNGSAASWALDSPGNVNLNLLQDFASVALNDMTIIGKAVTASFYGRPPTHSYWNGCSTGGRQGLMLAQRYPDAYDGILALAPAINWVKFLPAEFWPQQVMKQLRYHPLPCELEVLRAAAIEACDGIDGVKDGVISLPGSCDFDARTQIGKAFDCNGANMTITSAVAEIANAAWTGPRGPNGTFLWYGLSKDAALSGLANTSCTSPNQSSCTGAPFSIAEEWLRYFIAKDPTFPTQNLSSAEYLTFFHRSVQEYQSTIDTADPDLSAFRAQGGKMLTWHGLADQLIFPNGTTDYYNRVLALDSQAGDFYRFFEAPGTAHCEAGVGPYPNDTLAALVRWVEDGRAPETLTAVGRDGTVRGLCPYPLVQRYVGGDPKVPGSFTCS